MGKTSKPLRILVHPDLTAAYNWDGLVEQGHTIHYMANPTVAFLPLFEYDLILGPNAWRMTPDLVLYLDTAMKAARKELKKR